MIRQIKALAFAGALLGATAFMALPVKAEVPESDETIKVNVEQAEQARTTAHEIGHQLRLPHRQDMFNLMASGTTGWTFNQQEINRMRKAAVEKFGAKELN